MTRFSTKTLLMAAALTALTTSAFAQAATPTPWELSPDMGYGYDKDGKTFSYKMGTNNAGPAAEGRQEGAQGHACSSSARTASSTCAPPRSWKATASSCSGRSEGFLPASIVIIGERG